MRTAAARLLAAAIIAQAPAAAHALEGEELDALVARPSIGLYKAYAEFKMAHYASAREIWSALAHAGVAEAWFQLGILAEDGLGEPRDPARALDLYRRGGEAGSSKAQYRLGILHLEGRLLPADLRQARYWLAVAAANGDEEAARRLSSLPKPAPVTGP
jgi:TPR repeat protein